MVKGMCDLFVAGKRLPIGKTSFSSLFFCLILIASLTWPAFAQDQASPKEGTFEYYKSLAEKGNAEAQMKLGELYKSGKEVAQNVAESAKWYRKAAEQGLKDAQFKLGELLFEGKGIAQDAKEAADWLEKAATQGHQAAKDKLSEIKSKTQDSLKDLNKALDLIR